MGFTNNTLTAPFTKIAANGQGDLQVALGRTSCMSHFQLVADVDSNGDRVNKICVASKFKSFVWPTAVFTSAADREAARKAHNCGLTMKLYSTLANIWSDAIAAADGQFGWAYEPPRGSGTNINEPLRALDFVDAEHPSTRGYVPGVTFGFDYHVLPQTVTGSNYPPIIQIPNDVMVDTNGSIELSDLLGNGDAGRTTGHVYANIGSGYYFTVAYGKRTSASTPASGPEAVYSYSNPANQQVLIPRTGIWDIVMFYYKPQTGGQPYSGDPSPLSGDYVLSPYPHEVLTYSTTYDVICSGVMNSETKASIEVTLRLASGTYTCDHLAIAWEESGAMTEQTINRSSGFQITTTDQTILAGSGGNPWTEYHDFFLRVYSDSTNYWQYPLSVLQPFTPQR